MAAIHPLILCGGMGSRLWPMSRMDQPKQFQPVNGKGSLTYFQTTVLRHRGALFNDPIIVTNIAQSALVRQQLAEIDIEGFVIGEPVGRNTGPAVLAAALAILPEDPEAILLVLPSDHIIVGDINLTVGRMQPAATDGRIITFGITPAYAEAGYGYIMDGGKVAAYDGLHDVARFIEKPSVEIAQHLIDSGDAYWASGISMFRGDLICAEFQRLDPRTFATVSEAVHASDRSPKGMNLEETAFRDARDEPTERAVFENSAAISLAPIDVKWDDVGAWASVYDVNTKCDAGNVLNGDVMTLDTTNSLIRSDGRLVVVIGMDDLIVVDTKDALLVTDRKHAQQVKLVVEKLKSGGRREVVTHPFHNHAWGGIEALDSSKDYKLEILTLLPGATMQINGHGGGTSFLAVVSGQGAYQENEKRHNQALGLGSMLTIDRHVQISLINTADFDLRAILLSTTSDETGATVAVPGGLTIMPPETHAVAHG
ncbi:sugar phosphate nucleotidyltransferase [Frigidibacter sp.]|uniref:mannose-1-phosphate guanylyltransferase n=1 Tax=Frigidibacter sp. TaxID=2586418 RepID=UPI0027358533|nr:sugar phosphate nucleotidyltransferase [Frigidibacter sp.]MDP3340492.1 sugar phosphate nucleotidyltransferase [Frigidibacter sp.]